MEKGESRLQQLQGDVEDTKVIMVDNYNKVVDRGDKLEELDERAEELLKRGQQFQMTAKKVKEKAETSNSWMSCKNRKMIAICVGVGLVFLVILIIIISSTWSKE